MGLLEARREWRGTRRGSATVLAGLLALQACGGGGGSEPGATEEPPPPVPPAAGKLQLEATLYEVGESEQVVTFVVTRTDGSTGAVSVAVTTLDGTALAGEDYAEITTTASFADGDTDAKSGNVTIFDDDEHETEETLTLELANVTGGAALGATASATVTIHDDDPAAVTVSGSIVGLAGDGLVLRNNGGDDVPVGASEGSFRFPTPILEGDTYDVTVSVQPWAPAQHCEVTNGSGTASATGITGIVVSCADVPLQSLLVQETVGSQEDLLKMREDGNEFAVVADSVDDEHFNAFAGESIVFRRFTADGGDIYRVMPDGSGLEAVAASPQPESFGALAGGGALVVFDRQVGGTAATDDVFVTGLDGTAEVPLAASADDEEFVAVVPYAGTERIVYSRTISVQDDVYAVALDGSGTTALATDPEYESVFAVTPVGRVVFQRLTPNGYDLHSILADGTDPVALAVDTANEEFVAMLSDERLLYRREIEHILPGEPSQYDLYAVDADGTAPVTIADSTLSEYYQGLLPGGRLVFSRELSNGRELYAVNADGTSMATLAATDGYYASFAGLLPDGRIIYYNGDGGSSDLYLVNPDGSGTFQLTDTPEVESLHVQHQVTGSRLVFSREAGLHDDLFSIRFDGSDERQLTDTPDVDESIAGITASGGVLYHASSNGNLDLYRIGADGNGFVALGTTAEAERLIAVW